MSFVVVKYKDKELKVNPNCYLKIVYLHMRDQLGLPEEMEFDLRSEDGNMCQLANYSPNINAKSILMPRGATFIVVPTCKSKSQDKEDNRGSEYSVSSSTGKEQNDNVSTNPK